MSYETVDPRARVSCSLIRKLGWLELERRSIEDRRSFKGSSSTVHLRNSLGERKVAFQKREYGVKWWGHMCMVASRRYSYVSTYFMSLKAASYPASFTQGTPRRSKSTETYPVFLLFIRFPLMATTCHFALCNLICLVNSINFA